MGLLQEGLSLYPIQRLNGHPAQQSGQSPVVQLHLHNRNDITISDRLLLTQDFLFSLRVCTACVQWDQVRCTPKFEVFNQQPSAVGNGITPVPQWDFSWQDLFLCKKCIPPFPKVCLYFNCRKLCFDLSKRRRTSGKTFKQLSQDVQTRKGFAYEGEGMNSRILEWTVTPISFSRFLRLFLELH